MRLLFGLVVVIGAGVVGLTAVAWAAPGPDEDGEELEISGQRESATGAELRVRGSRADPGRPVRIERRADRDWVRVAGGRADEAGRFEVSYRPRSRGRQRVRAALDERRHSRSKRVRIRDVTLDAFGDVNLGNGVARVMRERGRRFPWSGVARTLRRADIAFGNLETSVSTRGRPVPKQFNFRGSPGALRVAGEFAGVDVWNLANNHVGDYGTAALADTVRNVRRYGMVPAGAGRNLGDARKPRIVKRLGLRVAFVGFSDIGPRSFAAGARKPGSVFASDTAIRAGVTAARRKADVVVATFHWGVERAGRENARQRGFASAAINAGADAVIGAHPHVLQPIRRPERRKLIAYSLGNFVWAAGSARTSATGILELRLSADGVERARLRRARISRTRPALR